jgi:hypothetical protein
MKRDLSTRSSIAIVVGAAVVAGVLVVATWPGGDNESSSTAIAAEPTPVSSPAESPAETPTPAADPDADLKFPKKSGDWTLFDVTFARSPDGTLGGTGQIGYTGSRRAATGTFTVAVYSGGTRVGSMTAATSQARPRTTTNVTWTSTDPWREPCDGVVFTAA